MAYPMWPALTIPEPPGAYELLHLDPLDAAERRWKWGIIYLPRQKRIELGAKRNPLLMAYEESLDQLNYLRRALYDCAVRDQLLLHQIFQAELSVAFGIRTLARKQAGGSTYAQGEEPRR